MEARSRSAGVVVPQVKTTSAVLACFLMGVIRYFSNELGEIELTLTGFAKGRTNSLFPGPKVINISTKFKWPFKRKKFYHLVSV